MVNAIQRKSYAKPEIFKLDAKGLSNRGLSVSSFPSDEVRLKHTTSNDAGKIPDYAVKKRGRVERLSLTPLKRMLAVAMADREELKGNISRLEGIRAPEPLEESLRSVEQVVHILNNFQGDTFPQLVEVIQKRIRDEGLQQAKIFISLLARLFEYHDLVIPDCQADESISRSALKQKILEIAHKDLFDIMAKRAKIWPQVNPQFEASFAIVDEAIRVLETSGQKTVGKIQDDIEAKINLLWAQRIRNFKNRPTPDSANRALLAHMERCRQKHRFPPGSAEGRHRDLVTRLDDYQRQAFQTIRRLR